MTCTFNRNKAKSPLSVILFFPPELSQAVKSHVYSRLASRSYTICFPLLPAIELSWLVATSVSLFFLNFFYHGKSVFISSCWCVTWHREAKHCLTGLETMLLTVVSQPPRALWGTFMLRNVLTKVSVFQSKSEADSCTIPTLF